MNKFNLEIDNIRKRIKKNKNPLYRQAMTDCLEDLEKMLSNKGPDLPLNLSSSFDSYLTKVYETEQKKKELDILLNLLIGNFTDLLKLLGIEDTLDIYCFFRVCLLDGFLSATGTFKTENVADNNDFPSGAKMVTGIANNNDINYFLAKLFKKMGVNATSISCVIMPVEYNTCIEAIKKVKTDTIKQITNVTLANANNSLLVIDHLNKECANNRDIDLFKFSSYGLLIDHSYERDMEYESRRQIYKLLSLSLLPVSNHDFIQSYGRAYDIYFRQYYEVKMFSEMNKELMNRIADYFQPKIASEDIQKIAKKHK